MKKLKKDVVVIGSGAAGLAAAIEAAQKGAKTVVLEKRKQIGGISVTAMGIFAAESHLQKMKNHPLTKEEAFHRIMDMTCWRANAGLVSRYVNQSAETIEWLEDMGVEFRLLDIRWGKGGINQTGHIVCTPEGLKLRGGITSYMIQAMLKRAEELGVEVLKEMELTDLEMENGHVVRAIARDAGGEEYVYDTKAVVMTSGGYLTNPEMLKEHDDRVLNKDFFTMHKIPLDGKGIQLAWKAGAGCDGMSVTEVGYTGGIDYLDCPKVKRVRGSQMLTGVVECPMLYVNLHGRRFVDESLEDKTYTAHAIGRQKDHTAYAILDSAGAAHLENYGVQDVGYMDRETNKLPGIEKIIQENAKEGTPYVVMADSIEELAEKCGINAETLKKTVADYNESCAKGFDEQFGKDRRWLLPIGTGKLYALKIRISGYGTVGGIRINENAEACTDNDDPVPGLYAAGDSANNLLVWDYSIAFKFWGAALGFAVNSGRIAGMSAGEYATAR